MANRQTFQKLRKGLNQAKSHENEGLRSFERDIFGRSSWYLQSQEFLNSVDEAGPSEKKMVGEKVETFKAMERFVQEKVEKKGGQPFKIPGGIVSPKAPQEGSEGRLFVLEGQESVEGLHFIQEAEKFESGTDDVDVLFIGETPKNFEQGDELLTKMIAAMKLKDSEYAKVYLKKTWEQPSDVNDEIHQIYSILSFINPRVIVSLGAVATNILLRKRVRLSKIHGEANKCSFQFKQGASYEFDFFPVFHPDLLLINPNMKRSAWLDLQKVLEHIDRPLS